MQVTLNTSDFLFYEYMHSRGIVVSYDSFIFNFFLRNRQTIFHMGYINLHSQKCTKISFSPHPGQHLPLVKMSIQFFYLFFNCVICFLTFYELLIYFKYWPFISHIICNHFLPFSGLSFHFVNSILCWAGACHFIWPHLFF